MIVLGVLFVIIPVCHSSHYRVERDLYSNETLWCGKIYCFVTLSREIANHDEAIKLCRSTDPNAGLINTTISEQKLEFQEYINRSRDSKDTSYLVAWKNNTDEKSPSCWNWKATSNNPILVACLTSKVVCAWMENGSDKFGSTPYSSTSPHLPSETTSPESSGAEPSSPESSPLAPSRVTTTTGDDTQLVTLAVIAGVIFVVLIISIVVVIIIFRKLHQRSRSEYCGPRREFGVDVTSTPNCYVSLDTTGTCEEGSKDIEGFYGVVQQTSTTDEDANMIDPTAADNGACKTSPGLIYADLEFLNEKPEEPETTEPNTTAT